MSKFKYEIGDTVYICDDVYGDTVPCTATVLDRTIAAHDTEVYQVSHYMGREARVFRCKSSIFDTLQAATEKALGMEGHRTKIAIKKIKAAAERIALKSQ